MPAPIVVIAVLLEPHAYASPLQFCSRASIRPQFSGAAVSPHQMNRLSSHPLPPLSPPKTRIGTKSASQLQFGTPFSLLGALFCFFSTPLPSFSGTSVLPFSWNVRLSSRYVSTIGLVVVPGLHSSRMERSASPERWFTLGDPARSDDEKTPNRNSPQAAAFTYRAPRQPSLQDYAAHAHPPF